MGCLSDIELHEIKNEIQKVCVKYKIPQEILNLIHDYSRCRIFCDICLYPMDSSRDYRKSISWSVYGTVIKCNKCIVPLNTLYKNRFVRKSKQLRN